MREKKSDKSEMTNQVLFGESFQILKKTNKWSYIELHHDTYKGWVNNKQFQITTNLNNRFIISNKKQAYIKINSIRQPLILGSLITKNNKLKQEIHLNVNLSFSKMKPFELWFVKIAKKYLNTPYLWGGRTTLGIDCSGYTQMVYRLFETSLPRDSHQQAKVGQEILDIKNIKMGDLAFFSKKNKINHVGIVLNKKQIIHASGKVRIDKLDNNGIFNEESNSYTHTLQKINRVI